MCAESIILDAFKQWIKSKFSREYDLNNDVDLNHYETYRIGFKHGYVRGYKSGWEDRKNEEFKKAYQPTEIPKLPIGLRPRIIAESQRINEILEAMGLYNTDAKQIPVEWLIELQELTGNKSDEKKNFIVYYDPGETYFLYSNEYSTTGGKLDNTTIAKKLCEFLSDDKNFQVPAGFRIAQKINGEYKEIFPAKEPISNV